jgi:uncharacterized protein YciW
MFKAFHVKWVVVFVDCLALKNGCFATTAVENRRCELVDYMRLVVRRDICQLVSRVQDTCTYYNGYISEVTKYVALVWATRESNYVF